VNFSGAVFRRLGTFRFRRRTIYQMYLVNQEEVFA
jgi:hypothetical protein